MKVPPRFLLAALLVGTGLLTGMGTVFVFYVAGLFGDGADVPVAVWERTLKATFLLGPVLGAFVVLGLVSWVARWRSGLTPWAAGALGVVFLARWDSGILRLADWVAGALLLALAAWVSFRRRG